MPLCYSPRRLAVALFSIAALLAPPLGHTQTPAIHSWTASDGRVIEAKFIKLDGESVVIEKAGKAFAVPFEKLKPESVEQAKKLAGASAEAPLVKSTETFGAVHTWVRSDGPEFKGRFVKFNGESAVIDVGNEALRDWPLAKLAPESAELAKRLGSGQTPFALSESVEVRKNGAFGFPQSQAVVIADKPEFRLSAWSNAEWLYVQAVIWADGNGSNAQRPGRPETGDFSGIVFDWNADKQMTFGQDGFYSLDPSPKRRGLHRLQQTSATSTTGSRPDSKGRGAIRLVDADNSAKVRVDSYLIPLDETGRKPGEAIRLVFWAKSAVPAFEFNSALVSTEGKESFYPPPFEVMHDLVLGQQSGTINADLVPEDRK